MAVVDLGPVTHALAAVLAGLRDARELSPQLLARVRAEPAFAPLQQALRHAHSPVTCMQRCLELPADAPLHRAAAGMLCRGEFTETVHVAVARGPRPQRRVHLLARSLLAPVVYAGELPGRVSVWSIATGEHLEDLPFPQGDELPLALAEAPDGAVRVVTHDHQVLERRPGEATFTAVLAFPVPARSERVWAGSDDLRFHLVKQADGRELQLYDLESQRSRKLALAKATSGNFLKIGPTQIGTLCAAYGQPPEFVVIDLATGSVQVTQLPGEVGDLQVSDDGLALIFRHGPASEVRPRARFVLATGACTIVPAGEIDPGTGYPRELAARRRGCHDGLRYDVLDSTIRDQDERVLAQYAHDLVTFSGMSLLHTLLAGPHPGWFVLAVGEPPGSLSLIAPYDPARVTAALPARPPPPPSWARPGVVLVYDSEDHDAADTHRYRVLACDGGLTLQIDRIADALRFTPAALARATVAVVVAQGSVDVDVHAPLDERLPPCLLGREQFARLVAGETLPFVHPWLARPGTLVADGAPTTRCIAVDDAEVSAPVRVFTGDAGTLVVLDDPRWPWIVEYTAGDCSLTLQRVRLPGGAHRQFVARRLEAHDDAAAKFCEITVEGAELRVCAGKLGAAGKLTRKSFPDPAAAARAAEKLAREKLRKGFRPPRAPR